MKSRAYYFCLFLFLAFFLCPGQSVGTGPKFKHVVVKGDNLWSICQRYYNDPWVWPELWEMNQFITNPHWIRPGEVITLYDYGTLKAKAEKRIAAAKKTPMKEIKRVKEAWGVDISSFTNTKALGFLQRQKEESWGTIFDLEAEKILVGKDDTVYVRMIKEGIRSGDLFTICNISDVINHPVTGEPYGYIHIFKGILEITKAQEGYHIAQIRESFRTIRIGDLLIPYYPASSCILPLPCQGSPTAYVVAAKDNLNLHGQHSVIYIDAGQNSGIMTGNIFEAIQERESISDEQKGERVVLPPTILGKILILQTQENTATGVVFWASKDFSSGVKIRPSMWDEQPKELRALPTCRIE